MTNKVKYFAPLDSKAISEMEKWTLDNPESGIELVVSKRFINQRTVSSDNFLSLVEWQHFIDCDAVIIFGTWGSKHPQRQMNPVKEDFVKNQIKRQAYLEYMNTHIVDLCNKFNKILIVIETATLSRIRQNYYDNISNKTLNPRYYRLGINHWTYSRTTWCDASMDTGKRNQTFIKNTRYNGVNLTKRNTWKFNEKGDIYIVAGLEHDPTSNMAVDQWIQQSIEQLLDCSHRNIVVRPHPLSRLDYNIVLEKYLSDRVTFVDRDKQQSLKHDSVNMYSAVVDSSTSVFQLLELGIPVFCTEHSFAAPFGNLDLQKIEDPILENKIFYDKWFKEMCYTEFTITEYANGTIFKYIEQLIKKYKENQNV